MNNETPIRRSRLILPINVDKFVAKAYTRNADALVLDLEDSIPAEGKEHARHLIDQAVPQVKQGGSEIFVRVNMDDKHLYKDISASICQGIDGIVLPKVESTKQVKTVDQWITSLEEKRGISKGSTQISLLIETAKGFINMKSILQSSGRIDSLTLGMEDLASNMGLQLNDNTAPTLNHMRMKVVYTARAFNVFPMGLMGSITNFSDLSTLEHYARLAYEHGFIGASCIHPDQVEILNKGFSPTKAEIQESKDIVDVFEKSLSEKRASASFNGKMIDYPHYEKAKNIIEAQRRIEVYEMKKQRAREKTMGGVKNDK